MAKPIVAVLGPKDAQFGRGREYYFGRCGPTVAMGIPRNRLPFWDEIQILAAEFARRPLATDTEVDCSVVIGLEARRPLRLDVPLLVTDMSFGSLSHRSFGTGLDTCCRCQSGATHNPDAMRASPHFNSVSVWTEPVARIDKIV